MHHTTCNVDASSRSTHGQPQTKTPSILPSNLNDVSCRSAIQCSTLCALRYSSSDSIIMDYCIISNVCSHGFDWASPESSHQLSYICVELMMNHSSLNSITMLDNDVMYIYIYDENIVRNCQLHSIQNNLIRVYLDIEAPTTKNAWINKYICYIFIYIFNLYNEWTNICIYM